MAGTRERLAALGITLPAPAAAIATYVPFVQSGKLLIVSGQLPFKGGVLPPEFLGKLGGGVSMADGMQAAHYSFINVLAQVSAAVGGDLDRVARVVRLGGFIACVPDFAEHASVMNGASDLAVAVFAEVGRHARSTIGVASLPKDAAVEVEGMFELI
jgi:enamine deaminase RidA (YjgF/YER057c/UK114 family)